MGKLLESALLGILTAVTIIVITSYIIYEIQH